LVAQRISGFTDFVGRKRVLAGTDCGFGTIAGLGKVDVDIVYKTWASRVQGAGNHFGTFEELTMAERRSDDPKTDGRSVPGVATTVTPKQLQYAVHDGIALSGTLYRPERTQVCPAVIAVHGGGWRIGSPDRYREWGQWLSSRGIALFAIQYRLTDQPQNVFPAAALDVAEAVRFVHANASELGLDPNGIVLMGDSAGAHLVSLVALTGGTLGRADARGDFPMIKAVVAVYGVYDLLAQWEHDQIARPRDQITEALMACSPLDDRLAFFRASPIAYATTTAPRVPFLVSWGTQDDIVDWASQSGRFVTALKQTGQFVRTVAIVGAPHFWISDPIAETGSFTGFLAPKLCRFLEDRLGLSATGIA
jgi:acetyl esterase/lipase